MEEPLSITIYIKEGKRGRWRWYAYDQEGSLLACSAVRGFRSQEDAIDASNLVVSGCPDATWVDGEGVSLEL